MKYLTLFTVVITTSSFTYAAERPGSAKEFSAVYNSVNALGRLCTPDELKQLAEASMNDAYLACRSNNWTYCYKRLSAVVKNSVSDYPTCEVKSFVDGVFYQPH